MSVCHCGFGARTVVLGLLGDDSGSVFFGVLHYYCFRSVTVVFVFYHIIVAGTVLLGFSGCGFSFSMLVSRDGPWFLMAGA